MRDPAPNHDQGCGPAVVSRRSVLAAGAGLVAAPVLAGAATIARAAAAGESGDAGPISARAHGAVSATAPLGPVAVERRAMGSLDVLLDVLFCGVCRSDIHIVRSEWRQGHYPCVPGHEIVGRVRAVGTAVTKFKVGDIGGVVCMVESCGTCENCQADCEQNCLSGATFSYDSTDHATGGYTFGGYSDKVVVTERFVIPPGADLAATAPLLCAGITTFSPIQHRKLAAGQRVGVIELGGLGHMAVKLAVARKADVTVFTTSPGKIDDAKRLGAKEAVLSTDAEAMKQQANRFDLLISTVPKSYPMQPFMDALKLDVIMVNVGALDTLQGPSGMALAFGRKSLAGSLIGGVAETQEVIDYCAARNIKADIELIGVQDINQAYERVVQKDVRYRFVIDMASLKAPGPRD